MKYGVFTQSAFKIRPPSAALPRLEYSYGITVGLLFLPIHVREDALHESAKDGDKWILGREKLEDDCHQRDCNTAQLAFEWFDSHSLRCSPHHTSAWRVAHYDYFSRSGEKAS